MDEYYIKENNHWTGPFVQSEFEVKIAGMEEVVFWKPEFCPNGILHPALCSHFKTMGKATEEKLEEPDISRITSAKEQALGSEEISADKITTTEEKQEIFPVEEQEELTSGLAGEVHRGNNGKKQVSEPQTTSPEPETTAEQEEKTETTTPPIKPEEPEKETAESSSPEEKAKEPTPGKEQVTVAEKETPPGEPEKEKEPEKETPREEKKETPSVETTVQKPGDTEQKPAEEKQVEETIPKTEPPAAPAATPVVPVTKENEKQSYLLKLAVIVIGFLLVILAGFYVNSRLSVVKYQDAIIRNYIDDINSRTGEIVKEQRVLQQKMDSLKVLLGKELKAIKEVQSGARSGR